MKKVTMITLSASILLMLAGTLMVRASDHDDGEIDLKGRNLNLTDLYVFREGDQTGNADDNANLIFILNTNPRSLAGFQYYFSTQARYEFHVSRATDRDVKPTGSDDVIIRFTFSAPDTTTKRQNITVTATKDGTTSTASTDTTGATMTTTSIADAQNSTTNNFTFKLGDSSLTVFAGLREDPFFFDVEGFFLARGRLLRGLSAGTFPRPAGTAVDFTAGYNVNAIVLRVPKTFLGSGSIFDVWETISVPK